VATIEYAIKAIALADLTVAGLIGTRWYPDTLPENPIYPAVVYQQISQVTIGSHTETANLAQTRLQLTLWCNTFDQAITLRNAIRTVLNDYRGSSSGVRIDRCQWYSDLSTSDPITQKFNRFIDLMIWHNLP
jgi:hypothetical protein